MKRDISPRRSGSGTATLCALFFLLPLTLMAAPPTVTDTLPKRTRPLVNNARLPQPLRDTGDKAPVFRILPFSQLKAEAQNLKRVQVAAPLITTGKTNAGNTIHKSGLLFTPRQLFDNSSRSSLDIYMAMLQPTLLQSIKTGYNLPVSQYMKPVVYSDGKPWPHAVLIVKDLPTVPRLYLLTIGTSVPPAWIKIAASNADGTWKREYSGADLIGNSEGTEIRLLVDFPTVVAGSQNEFGLSFFMYHILPANGDYPVYARFSHLQWIQLD